MTETQTRISKEPRVAPGAMDLVSRINPSYKYPQDLDELVKFLRLCLGLPYKKSGGGYIPYGYTFDSSTGMHVPNQEVMAILWQARRYLYTSSIREVADWVTAKVYSIGYKRKISHQGLRNIMVTRPPYEECLLPVEEKEKLIESLTKWLTIA